MISPQAEKVAENDQNPGRIVPVYPLTAGLTQRDMARVTEAALDAVPGDWPDPLPEVLRVKYRLPDAADALAAIHRPKNREDVNEARRRMVFEELFLLCCGLQQLRGAPPRRQRHSVPRRTVWRNFSQLCRSLRRAHSAAPSWKSRRTAPQAAR